MIKTPDKHQKPWSPQKVFQVRLGPEIFFSDEMKRKWHHKNLPVRKYRNFQKEYAEAFTREYDASTKRIALLRKLQTIPDILTISVGVVEGSYLHQSVSGKRLITYEQLFKALWHVSNNDFDPLVMIRDIDSKVESEIKNEILSAIKSGNVSRQLVISKLNVIAARLHYLVKDYIEGGKAPRLAWPTIGSRMKKSKKHPELYHGSQGIYHPLIESGQLVDAISYKVFVEQSAEMRKFVNEYVDSLAAKIRKMRRIDRGESSASRRMREYKQSKELAKAIRRARTSASRGTGAEIDARDKLSQLQEMQESETERSMRIIRKFINYVSARRSEIFAARKEGDKKRSERYEFELREYVKNEAEAIRIAQDILKSHKIPIPRAEWM